MNIHIHGFWRSWSLVSAVCVVLLFLLAEFVLFPRPQPNVNVAWNISIDEERRHVLESRYNLTPSSINEEGTWIYVLRDTSVENVAALVRDSAVRDTHHIDRSTFEVHNQSPSHTRQNLLLALLVGLPMGSFALLIVSAITRTRSSTHSLVWESLFRGIPKISGRTLGFVRITYAAYLVYAVSQDLTGSWSTFPIELHRTSSPIADWVWVHWLATEPVRWLTLDGSIIVLALLFLGGIGGRKTYALLTAGLTCHVLVQLIGGSSHSWGLPLVTAIGLLAVPWERTPSLRTLFDKERSQLIDESRISFGFALWWPSLTLGVAFLAAAVAKLRNSGIAWITDGAVRYHFITDVQESGVDWGLSIATSDALSILFSLAAICVEASIVAVVFVKRPAIRLVFAAAASSLFLGWGLFQGVYWFPWWGLLFAFLPWEWCEQPHGTIPEIRSTQTLLRPFQVFVVALFIIQQLVSSTLQFEIEPLISDFPMYSHTYPSKKAFNEALRWNRRQYRYHGTGTDTTNITSELERSGIFSTFNRIADTRYGEGLRSIPDSLHSELRSALDLYEAEYGKSLDSLGVSVTTYQFDWNEGNLHQTETYLGYLNLQQLIFVDASETER